MLLPAGVDLTAYRLVQEALRRAREGGHAARASVRVTYAAGEVRIEVVDDGAARGPPAARPARARRRLRRRAQGRRGAEGGGWRVAARLPVGAAA